MALTSELEAKISDKLARMGLELFEIRYIRAGARSALRVFIERPVGRVSIDDCEDASREISMLLDVEDFSNQPYTLEVSSPGLDRVLTSEKDFSRVIGEQIRLRVKAPNNKQQTVTGTLTECRSGVLTITADAEAMSVPLSEVLSGKIEVTFK
jgi:ribosome maturation factor RimP